MNQTLSAQSMTPKSTLFFNESGIPQVYYVVPQDEFVRMQSQLQMYANGLPVPKVLQETEEEKEEKQTLMSRDEAARMLHVDKSTLWRWEKDGRLKSIKIGPRRILYKREDVDELVKSFTNQHND